MTGNPGPKREAQENQRERRNGEETLEDQEAGREINRGQERNRDQDRPVEVDGAAVDTQTNHVRDTDTRRRNPETGSERREARELRVNLRAEISLVIRKTRERADM